MLSTSATCLKNDRHSMPWLVTQEVGGRRWHVEVGITWLRAMARKVELDPSVGTLQGCLSELTMQLGVF